MRFDQLIVKTPGACRGRARIDEEDRLKAGAIERNASARTPVA